MLTAEFISALLSAEEGETLALKERFGADVIETAVPFANTHGGTILMGVYDEAPHHRRTLGQRSLARLRQQHCHGYATCRGARPYRWALGADEVVTLQISEVPLKPVANPVIARSAATKPSSNGHGMAQGAARGRRAAHARTIIAEHPLSQATNPHRAATP